MNKINIALFGVGNCVGALAEGLTFYKNNNTKDGLLFETLGGYKVSDINIVCAFDITEAKVGKNLNEAIRVAPNNYNSLGISSIIDNCPVYRGTTLDGSPEHLSKYYIESKEPSVNIVDKLQFHNVDVAINLLPTGSIEATKYYGDICCEAGVAYINCTPSVYASNAQNWSKYESKNIPLIGDDIKSQVGSTIIHRALLNCIINRGGQIAKSSQTNIGGNMDFANFVFRADTKLKSKYGSLSQYVGDAMNHIGHHYDKTKEGYKKAIFEIEAAVFGNSKIKIETYLHSDDKPNAAGSIVDLIRIAKYEKDNKRGGLIEDACYYYIKSTEKKIDDYQAFLIIQNKWGNIL